MPPFWGWHRPVAAQFDASPVNRPAALPAPTPLGQEAASLPLPPGEQVFRAEPEAVLLERLRRESLERGQTAQFPGTPGCPRPRGCRRRRLPPSAATVVPYVVCYRPLYFEDKNTERYGRTLGVVQPVVSTGKFYLDILLLPYHLAVLPPWQCECNTGYCLPGDPVPYLIYPPGVPFRAWWPCGSACCDCAATAQGPAW